MSITQQQALEALDELEGSARGDEPFNHFAAPLLRQYIEQGAQTHKAEDAPTERDAQDAARYRWLRDGELTADYPYPVMRMGGSRVDDQTIWNDELDAAIDAAMAKD